MNGVRLADRVAAMTPEQRQRCEQLVTQNKGLAYWCVRKNLWCVPWMEEEDVVQIALTAMWRAAMTYDPARATFSTYATSLMVSHIRRQYQSKRRSETPDLSLDYIYGEDTTMLSQLAAPDELDAAMFRLSVQHGLHGRTRRIIEAKMDGATLQEIADVEGITRERVRQLILESVHRDGLAA